MILRTTNTGPHVHNIVTWTKIPLSLSLPINNADLNDTLNSDIWFGVTRDTLF